MEIDGVDLDGGASPAVASVPRPASTVVLLRAGSDGPEVLLTQRPSTMVFAADAHVFPGGAVDPGDSAPAAFARSRLDPAAAARALGGELPGPESLVAHLAAIRELWEEAGVALVGAPGRGRARLPDARALLAARTALLAGDISIGEVADDLDVELRTDLLGPLSRWVTPPFVGRRFDTRFFVAELPAGVSPSFVEPEVVGHRWLTPRAALDAMAAGEISLWWPTSTTLQQLEHATSFEEVRTRLCPGPSAAIRLEEAGVGLVRVGLSSAGGIGGQSVNAWVVGRRDLVVVDPGDPSEAATDALLALAESREATISAVAVTHADPDHTAGAEALALGLGVPMFGGEGARRDLPSDVRELADGDRLPAGDVELVALATPGPRADHTAFVVPSAGAILVGDLVGPGPSRSILGPPDVAAWLASLDRIEALAPGRILPGHGPIPPDPKAAIETQRRRLPPDFRRNP